MANGKGEKMVTLVSKDEKEFKVEERVAKKSNLLKTMIKEEVSMNKPIRIVIVNGDVLGTVLEYCEKHAKAGEGEGEEQKAMMDEFDQEFMEKTNLDMLYGLMVASNYLDIEGLLELTTQRAADLIKGKKPEEIRALFGIKNDFDPQEYAKISRDFFWAFKSLNLSSKEE
ncbi:SKP1-like protein 13 [Dioscorea cayenensis subsp. rotundata]|uniref:SKP1-like protein n=1 Tax=Dioscorea cayennensis subsp. rotundata TaxID=55577 RepID=A0AB40B293_DIOCR|nr:SKP1-like protein 13 [Dioscorea cayenensis subsp. rotundata]